MLVAGGCSTPWAARPRLSTEALFRPSPRWRVLRRERDAEKRRRNGIGRVALRKLARWRQQMNRRYRSKKIRWIKARRATKWSAIRRDRQGIRYPRTRSRISPNLPDAGNQRRNSERRQLREIRRHSLLRIRYWIKSATKILVIYAVLIRLENRPSNMYALRANNEDTHFDRDKSENIQ